MSKKYSGEFTEKIAFPLGGIGAGMVAIEGRGALSHVSIRNQPNVFFEPCVFSAVCVKGEENIARVLEGPVPRWKGFGLPGSGNGLGDRTYGFPRLDSAEFSSRFPFACVEFESAKLPLDVKLNAWSPFIPGNADDSSLPVASLEYTFSNPTEKIVEAVYSFNSRNFMNTGSGKAAVLDAPGGFILWEPGAEDKPWDLGAFCATIDDPAVQVDHAWFRGGGFDSVTMIWKDIEAGNANSKPVVTEGEPAPGGSLFVPFSLNPGESKTIKVMLSWFVPNTNITIGELLDGQAACESGCCCSKNAEVTDKPTHKPWYAGKFADIREVAAYWKDNYDSLRDHSIRFTQAFFDTTLPEEVIDAVEANLTILKSPTCLRQIQRELRR